MRHFMWKVNSWLISFWTEDKRGRMDDHCFFYEPIGRLWVRTPENDFKTESIFLRFKSKRFLFSSFHFFIFEKFFACCKIPIYRFIRIKNVGNWIGKFWNALHGCLMPWDFFTLDREHYSIQPNILWIIKKQNCYFLNFLVLIIKSKIF